MMKPQKQKPTNKTTDHMNTTIPPEGAPFPADSTPFTWGDFKKHVAPSLVDIALTELRRAEHANHLRQRFSILELNLAKLFLIVRKKEAAPGDVGIAAAIRDLAERLALQLESIAGSSSDSVEAITNAGDSITLATLFRIIDGLPPSALAALKKHIGLIDGETLKP